MHGAPVCSCTRVHVRAMSWMHGRVPGASMRPQRPTFVPSHGVVQFGLRYQSPRYAPSAPQSLHPYCYCTGAGIGGQSVHPIPSKATRVFVPIRWTCKLTLHPSPHFTSPHHNSPLYTTLSSPSTTMQTELPHTAFGRHQTHPAARHHSRPTYTTALTLAPCHTISHTQHTRSSAPRQSAPTTPSSAAPAEHDAPPPDAPTHRHAWTANPTPRSSHQHHGPPRPASPALPPARRPSHHYPHPDPHPSFSLIDRLRLGRHRQRRPRHPRRPRRHRHRLHWQLYNNQYHLCPPLQSASLKWRTWILSPRR